MLDDTEMANKSIEINDKSILSEVLLLYDGT